MASVVLAAFAGLVAWLLLQVYRAYLKKSTIDNIPGPERTSFWHGNFPDLYGRHSFSYHERIANMYGGISKFYAPFGVKGLYVFDPQALHSIIIKDQAMYEETLMFTSWYSLALGAGLLATVGQHHKKQRKLLNPVFSGAHMRNIAPLFYATVHRLRTAVENQAGNASREVDIVQWMARVALELVGQGGLGYSFDPLTEHKSNEFSEVLKDLIPTSLLLQPWRVFYSKIAHIGTRADHCRLMRWIPQKEVQRLRNIIETSDRVSRSIWDAKKAALEKGNDAVVHQIGEGKDIISTLMKANLAAETQDQLLEDELIAQMATLVFTATDTTSSALARTFQLLAEWPDVQEKLRTEVLNAAEEGCDIPYDELVALPFLDAVCRETLRLYPSIPYIVREALGDTVLPFSRPIQGLDGTMISEIPITKKTLVFISLEACNRNKDIWGDDACEWKPERWLSPLPTAVTEARIPGVYSNLMTFAGGSKSCIGFKFSQLEMKVVLAVMLRSFSFRSANKDIYWNYTPITFPTVGNVSREPSLPIVVEALKAENLA